MAGSNGYAEVQFTGNLGGDPELRFLPDGTAVASFSVAVTGRKKSGNEYVDDVTAWYRVTCWKYDAEAAVENLRKGSRVHVVGVLKPTPYTAKDGTERLSLEVNTGFNGVTQIMWASKGERKSAPANDDPWGDEPAF